MDTNKEPAQMETTAVYDAQLTLFGNCPKRTSMREWIQATENQAAHKQNRLARVCTEVVSFEGNMVVRWAKL